VIQKDLKHGGGGFVYVANDPDGNLEIVLKLIILGAKKNEAGNNNKELMEKEMKVGMIVAKECDFLVSYLEIFEWEDYLCMKMEYCLKGDIESKFEEGRIFTEEV
jgi:serine/threonine protein kinase